MTAAILMPSFARRGAPPGHAEAVHAVAEAVRSAIGSGAGYSEILAAASSANLAAMHPLRDRLVVALVDAAIAARRRP